MTEQEINNLIDSKIGKTKMSQLPEATQTSGLYSIGYTGNQSVKYKANLLQGDPLTVRKTYQTEALALADKNPVDPTTSLPLTVGQFVSIVDDGEKNGIYRISSIGVDGTMSLELQGRLGDLSDYANHGYESNPKTLKEVDDEKADQADLAQLESDVEQLAYVRIKNEVVNGTLENGLIDPFKKNDGGGGESTLAINSSTPISGNYDVRFTITTPGGWGRPYLNGLHGAGNIGDKIYLHFYAKILSGVPKINEINNGVSLSSIYGGDVINGRNTRIIDVMGLSANLGVIYFNSPSVWDMQMDNFMRINLTETFGAGNEPTEEEMNLLLDIAGISYIDDEVIIPAQKVMQWQLKLDNTAAQNADDARLAIQADLAQLESDVMAEYSPPFTMEIGTLNESGEEFASFQRVRTSLINLVDGYPHVITNNSTLTRNAIIRYLDGVFVSAYVGSLDTIPADRDYNQVRLVYKKQDNSNFTQEEVNDLEGIGVTAYIAPPAQFSVVMSSLNERLSELDIKYSSPFTMEIGTLNLSSGEEITVTNIQRVRTSLIDLVDGYPHVITNNSTLTRNAIIRYLDGVFVSSYSGVLDTIPADRDYNQIRLVYSKQDNSNFTQEDMNTAKGSIEVTSVITIEDKFSIVDKSIKEIGGEEVAESKSLSPDESLAISDTMKSVNLNSEDIAISGNSLTPSMLDIKNTTDTHTENINIPGGSEEAEKVIIFNLHRGAERFTKNKNDIFFNSKCRTDFSDVHFFDEEDEIVNFDVVAHGNYDVVNDTNIPNMRLVRMLSDGRLVTSDDNKRLVYSSDNGSTWSRFGSDSHRGLLIFVGQGDVIFTHDSNKVYRSEPPYDTFDVVIDYTLMDAGDGIALQHSMVQFSSGEYLIGRYQYPHDVLIMKSTDDGQTWVENYRREDFQHVHQLYLDSTGNSEVVYCGMDMGQGYIKTVDKGDTWQYVDSPQTSDYGVIYADPSGYKLIGGETTLKGGYTLHKTWDEVDFYPVLNSGKGVYFVKKMNGNLYAGVICTGIELGCEIYRSTDEGETWNTIYMTGHTSEGGASDGFRYLSDVLNPIGSEEDFIIAGNQTNIYNPVRIYDGGDNYNACIIMRLNVPITGRQLRVESGYLFPSRDAKVRPTTTIDDDCLVYIPFNEGFGQYCRELVSGEVLGVSGHEWDRGLKKLGNSWPFIRASEDLKSIKFNDGAFTNTPFNMDLSSGNFTISFWTTPIKVEDTVIPSSHSEVLLAFNPGTPNESYLARNNRFFVVQDGKGVFPILKAVLVILNPNRDLPRLVTVTVNSQGDSQVYINGVKFGGSIENPGSYSPIDLSKMKGEVYLFGTPPSVRAPFIYTAWRSTIQHFQIIDRLLSEKEAKRMYDAGITDLIINE